MFFRSKIIALKLLYDLILVFIHLLTFLLKDYSSVSSFLKVNTVGPLFVENTVYLLLI